MSNPALLQAVRAAMLQCAAVRASFDAARLATMVRAPVAEIEPVADYLFWIGALTPFHYRRQARTGLAPLFNPFTGELPGTLVEAPPADARAPEAMPAEWRIEVLPTDSSAGVLFRGGERAALSVGGPALAVGDDVRVRWRRSPSGHFNIVESVEPPSRELGARGILQSLARVRHLDATRQCLLLDDERGLPLEVPTAGRAVDAQPGDVVRVEWGRGATGHVPVGAFAVRRRPTHLFLAKWLTDVEAVLGFDLPSRTELAETGALSGLDVGPLALVDDEAPLFAAIGERTTAEWIRGFDYKDVPYEELADALGLRELPPIPPDSDWAAALNGAAERAGLPRRVFALVTGGDDHLVLLLRPQEWEAFVAAGAIVRSAPPSDRAPRSFDEAREWLGPDWYETSTFASFDELLAFATGARGQLERSSDGRSAAFDHEGLCLGIRSVSFAGEPWVELATIIAFDPNDDASFGAFASDVSSPLRLSRDGDLSVTVPLRFASPARIRAILEELVDARAEARETLGIDDES